MRNAALVIEAVVFDLDGVLIDSERVWDEARRSLVERCGSQWAPGATEAMMGMSATEWSSYLHDRLGVVLDPSTIREEVGAGVLERYRAGLPVLPGALEAVETLGSSWRLALASSSNKEVIDEVLLVTGLDRLFEVVLSSEEVRRGKPAPDVYLETARRLGTTPASCAVVEDSANGIRAGAAAGMMVVAIPNRHFPPAPEALALAKLVVPSIKDLTPATIERLG